MIQYALQTNGLTKKYKENIVLNQVNMTIKHGEIYGLIGRNGAGKTTLMKLITGLAKPTAGTIKIFEEDNLEFQRSRIGASIETPAIYYDLTAKENLEAIRILLGIPDKKVVEEMLEVVALQHVGDKKVKHFSLGMKQRLEIGITLMGNPDILMLDEPINGLDPQGIIELRELLTKLNKEKQLTILISSHILGELSKIATYYGILNKGNLIDEFSKQELEIRCKRCIKIKVDDVQKATNILEIDCHTKNYDVLPQSTIRLFDYLDNPSYVNAQLSKKEVMIESINVVGQDLEAYFMELMGGERDK